MLSMLKSLLLASADAFNGVVGGPRPFTRQVLPDPYGHFVDDMTRRDYIEAEAEKELGAFVARGCFFAQKPNDLGDAAIWQGVYAAMTVQRWRAKRTIGAELAMMDAARALAGYLAGGIVHRGAVPASLENLLFHRDPTKTYYVDSGEVMYRDDASLDSLLGLMYGAAVINRWGTDEARAIIAPALGAFSDRFTASGYRLINRDGAPTTYGDCRPGFFQAPVRILAAALPSLVGGRDDWRGIAARYGAEFARTDTQVPGKISYVNAHLAILANLAYVTMAPVRAPGPAGSCPGLDAAANGLRTLCDKYADAGNAFVVFGAAGLGLALPQAHKDKARKVLSEFPLGPKPKSGLNSSAAPALQPVPVWQRPPSDVIWQRSPYPYSGSEDAAYSRMDYLIAHYLERNC